MDKETKITVLENNRKDLSEIGRTLIKAMDYVLIRDNRDEEDFELLTNLVRSAGKVIELDSKFRRELRELEL